MRSSDFDWDVREPYCERVVVEASDLDRFGHTNNVVYLSWLERVAWAHSVSLWLGTWIVENDGRLAMWRGYQIIRVSDGKTVLRGRTQWVCVDMKSGKPRRQPPEFLRAYRAAEPAA